MLVGVTSIITSYFPALLAVISHLSLRQLVLITRKEVKVKHTSSPIQDLCKVSQVFLTKLQVNISSWEE